MTDGKQKCLDGGGGKFSRGAEAVDRLVWQWVIAQFEQPDVIRAKYAKWCDLRGCGRVLETDRQAALEELLAVATAERDNCMELAVKTTNPTMRPQYAAMAEQANQQAEGYAKDLAHIQAILVGDTQDRQRLEDVITMGQQALDQLRAASYEDKRAVLYAFDVQVRLWRKGRTDTEGQPDNIEVSWVLDTSEASLRAWHRLSTLRSNTGTWQDCPPPFLRSGCSV